MRESVKISIIIPMHNVTKYISTTIQSIINQSFSDLEVLCVDDHSTDGSKSIVESYSRRYPFIHLIINNKQSGVSESRNLGLDMADGKYIMFVDADDKLGKDMIKLMLSDAIQQKADLVIGSHKMFNDQEILQHNMYKIFPSLTIAGEKKIIMNPELFYPIYVWGKLFKRELIQKVRFPKHIQYCEDQCFTIFAYLNASKIFLSPQAIYYYRVREENDPSLVKKADQDPSNAINDIINVLKINYHYFEQFISGVLNRNLLFGHYLNRVILYNVHGIVRNMFIFATPNDQIKIIHLLNDWINNLDDKMVLNVKSIQLILVQQMMNYIQESTPEVKASYIVLLRNIKTKMQRAAGLQ
ncbi:glycosyltransferase family 2 protein [Sporolactobacillus vineae]|uniref:glycosyltransferase family 2 protein n=1 Tax=Sporolactobacillus vineae TaxID=444463 RepID=UPI00028958A8|nr:glycosyltransferase family 2 protein [Sporolactobacillus vineae]